MSPMVTSVLVLLTLGFLALIVLVARVLTELRDLRDSRSTDDNAALLMLQQYVESLRQQLSASLAGNREEIDRRLEETNRVVGQVRRELGEVDRQMRSVGEAARDLRGLQELLRSPKVRGGIGEHLLAEMLAQVLPQAHFDLQHEFAGGDKVDAVIRLGDRLVPIDAKFPMENFLRLREASERGDAAAEKAAQRGFRTDLRRHVDAIAKRYIRPGEGTYDFAMMYIPAEGVYQEAIRQDGDDGLDLFHYALARRIVPVSPQSFYAYLQVIVLGLRGMSIERRAQEIMGRVGEVRQRLGQFAESFDLVGKHLGNAHRQWDEAGRRLGGIEAGVAGLAGGEGTTVGEIARPAETVNH